MPMLFWLPIIVFFGMCQVIEDDVRGMREAKVLGANRYEALTQ